MEEFYRIYSMSRDGADRYLKHEYRFTKTPLESVKVQAQAMADATGVTHEVVKVQCSEVEELMEVYER